MAIGAGDLTLPASAAFSEIACYPHFARSFLHWRLSCELFPAENGDINTLLLFLENHHSELEQYTLLSILDILPFSKFYFYSRVFLLKLGVQVERELHETLLL